MRILLWHGYLLGGTGSNVYTRMLAREWSSAGHDVTVLSQEPHPERYDLGAAATVRPDVGGLLPVFVLDRYDGYDVRRVQDCTRAELDALGRGERLGDPRAPARRRRLHEPRPARRAGRRRNGRPVRRQGARLRARVLDARQRGALGLGRRRAGSCAGDVRRLGAHPRRPRRGVRPHGERDRGAARRRHRRVGARAPRRRPRCADRGGAARRAEPRQRRGAPARRGQRRPPRALPRHATARSSSTSAS